MAKQTISQERKLKIQEESDSLRGMKRSTGWKIIETELMERLEYIKNLLLENRLRTLEETVKTETGSETYITTADQQKAEYSGRYLEIKLLLDFIQSIIEGPKKLQEAIKNKQVIVEDQTKEVSTHASKY